MKVKLEENLGLAYDYVLRNHHAFDCDVEDTPEYSDACIGLMKAVEKYNPNHECSFSTFAYICIRNSVIEGIRRRSKYKEEPSDPMLFDQNIYNDEPVALDMSLLNELLEVDDEDENDYLDKEILKLYYLNDLTHEAIGSKFGISKFSVSRKIKRAIKKIRSCHKELLNENKYECC